VIERASGVYLYDANGRRYIDGCSGSVVANIGHGVREIVDAMVEQASRVAFVHRTQFTSQPLEELAAEVCSLAPPTLEYCFFANSGSEASELALKLARQYWVEVGRPTKYWVLSRWTSYHGSTLGALSLSGHVLRRQMMNPLLHEFPAVPPAYCYRCFAGLSYPGCDLRCAEVLESAILRVGPQYVAAFFVEPIVGASGGAIVPPAGYFARVREICDRYEVLLVVDEVMTGFGRTGRNFGVDHWNVIPDIMVLGKGISAGYVPLAGVALAERIYEAIRAGSGRFLTGHTLSNNPLACAVGLAVLRYLRLHNLVQRAVELEPYLGRRLEELALRHHSVGDVRGKGLFWGIEFVRDPGTRQPFDASLDFTGTLVSECFERGLIVYPCRGGADGVAGDAILLAPPLVIAREQIDEMVDILDAALAAVEGQLKSAEAR
jgi:adenosylmethionine-8-amino-7-oxononanoate aminotransferase